MKETSAYALLLENSPVLPRYLKFWENLVAPAKKMSRKKRPSMKLAVEELEDRQLLTVTLTTIPGMQSNFDGATITTAQNIQAVATDTLSNPISYSATGLPSGLTINAGTGVISGQIAGNANTGGTAGVYTVDVTATDTVVTADKDSKTFTWKIKADPVTVTKPAAQTSFDGAAISLAIVSADSLHDALSYSAVGLPATLTISPTTGKITGTIAAAADTSSPYTVTVTATDATANASAAQTFTWTVKNPVTVTNPGNQASIDGATATLQISAADSEKHVLAYSATGLPTGLSISPTTGKITGQIAGTADTGSPYTTVVTVTDATAGASDSETFTWNVTNPVSVTNPGAQVNDDGATINFSVVASDSKHNTLAYAASNLPTGLSINATTGVISGTINAAAGPFSSSVTVTDATAGSSVTVSFTWTVNASPVSVTSPGIQTNDDGAAIALQILATDSLSNLLNYKATGLPSGLSISPTTGLITGTIAAGADVTGPYTVTVTATDSTVNASASQTFTWNVDPSTVSITNPGTQNGVDGTPVSLQVTASDTASNTLSYSATGLPPTLSINSTTGLITGTITGTDDAASPFNTVVTVTDSTANASSTAAFTWNVTNAVTVTNPGTQTNLDGDMVSLQIAATDSQNGDTLTYTASNLPSGLNISPTTGLISGQLAATADTASPYTVTVTASDATLNSSVTQTFTWKVTNPIVVTNPGTQASTDGQKNISVKILATDSQSHTLTYSATNLPTGLSINSGTGVITGQIAINDDTASPYAVTVTATDASNNDKATQSFSWDVTNAVSVTSPGNQTSDGLDTISLKIAATDSAGNKLSFAATGLPSGLTINAKTGVITGQISDAANSGSPYSVTVTATDATLNVSANQTFTWTVNAGPITGVAFFDRNGDATFDSGDSVLGGVTVILTGTPVNSPAINISGVTNTVDPTITTATADGLTVGEKVTIAGVVGATGVNGTFVVQSVPTLTTFTITTAAAPGVYTSGGTASGISTEAPITLTCVTNAAGKFSYLNPPSNQFYTYQVAVGAVPALKGKPSIANLVSPSGIAVTNNSVAVKTTPSSGGIGSGAISINQFLTNSSSSPYGVIGSGVATINHAPTVSTTITPQTLTHSGSSTTIDLAGHFTDADLSTSHITMNIMNGTTPETLGLTLYDKDTPQTVANFYDYIKSGEYNNSIFSRLTQVASSGLGVLQGGGAALSSPPAGTLKLIETAPPTVPSEFKAANSNVAGTIAMAQSSGVNSATDEFFFNDVSNAKSLDPQSFAVFGKLDASSIATLNTLASTPTLNASSSSAASILSGVDLQNLPLTGYTNGTGGNTSTTFPADATASNFMQITSVTIDKQPDFLTYSVTSSNPSIVTATLNPTHNEQLTLTPGATAGTSTITVTATDRFGLSKTTTFTVTVS